jgi:hypothetical protein
MSTSSTNIPTLRGLESYAIKQRGTHLELTFVDENNNRYNFGINLSDLTLLITALHSLGALAAKELTGNKDAVAMVQIPFKEGKIMADPTANHLNFMMETPGASTFVAPIGRNLALRLADSLRETVRQMDEAKKKTRKPN